MQMISLTEASNQSYLILIDYVWYEALLFKCLYLINTFIYEVLNIFSFLSCIEYAETKKS